MGLDTYASRSPDDVVINKEDIQAFTEANIQLCGGIMSGDESSFRGKVYALMILDITGVGLHQEWIPPETIREMYEALTACDPYQMILKNDWQNRTAEDIIQLQKFFKVCCERGLGLVGWW